MSLSVRALLGAVVLAATPALFAAEPPAGTVSPALPETAFDSGPFLTSGGVFCTATSGCDSYELTLDLPPDFAEAHPGSFIRFAMAWQFKLDLFLLAYADQDGAPLTPQSTTDLGSQTDYIPLTPGLTKIRVDITPAAANNSVIHAIVGLVTGDGEGIHPNPVGAGIPRHYVYAAPLELNGDTGEPSVGYNTVSKQAFVLSGLKTLWTQFPQDLEPALPESCDGAWAERSSDVTSVTSLDPIGFTDSLVRGHETNRTFIGQLVGINSAMVYSDDDGATWIPMQGGPPLSSTDHQTIVAGPYPADHPFGIAGNPIYPNAVYYCGQDVAFASCARSDNGGLTFGPPTPIFTIADCLGLHGHARVGPDGVVYVPSKACGTNVAVTVSEDAGVTWQVRPVPGTIPAIRDPQMALASDGTGYLCFEDGDKYPKVAVTKDRGVTWTEPVVLGRELGIKHSMFTQSVAGDPDRATCAYLGTTTEGNPTAADFPGTWHLYFSTTYDGGATWTTVNAAPNDPVQGVGGIWHVGGGPPNRNLLDFNEMTIDERGYPIYGYADGCIGLCDQDPTYNTFAAAPKLARQVAGRPLYAEFDPVEPRAPGQACLGGIRTPERTQLTWRPPENGGAAVSGYRVFRGLAPGAEEFVGSTDGTPGFIDLNADPAVANYYYKVTAVNAQGESLASNTIVLPITIPQSESPCGVPGVRMITDATGDAQDANLDLVSLHISEPPEAADQLIFQLKISSLATPPPGTMYAVLFHTPDQPLTNPNDTFVGMVAEGTGNAFVYGHRDESVIGIAVVQEYFVDGTLDASSSVTPDGTISLVMPRSLFELTDGERLSAISINTHTGALSSGEHIVRSTNTLDSAVAADPYVLRSADFCRVNTPPVASLVALPTAGAAPLDVVLNATGSRDAEDAVVEYIFDPGDRTALVTQAEPQLAHTYAERGFYRATLQVKDARGVVSQNVAQAVIDTTGAVAAAAPAVAGDSRFGGALGGAALLALLLVGLRRTLRFRGRSAS